MPEDKETEKDPKVKDLTPDKDAKGGVRSADANVSADRARFNVNKGGQNLDRGTGAN